MLFPLPRALWIRSFWCRNLQTNAAAGVVSLLKSPLRRSETLRDSEGRDRGRGDFLFLELPELSLGASCLEPFHNQKSQPEERSVRAVLSGNLSHYQSFQNPNMVPVILKVQRLYEIHNTTTGVTSVS